MGMRVSAWGYRLSRMTDGPNPDEQTDEKQTLEGTVAEMASDEHRRKAIDLAFDYRGDVTIETQDGRSIEGYIFDRAHEAKTPYIRVLPSDGSGRIKLEQSDIARITFSGKDTAAGRSWETWVNKWKQKKLKQMKEGGDQSASEG